MDNDYIIYLILLTLYSAIFIVPVIYFVASFLLGKL